MKKILIVDDEADHRMLVRMALERERYHCEEASNGRAALDVLLLHPVDLVITDLRMPRMNGFALVAAMKKSATLQQIPTILMTSQIPDGLSVTDSLLAPSAVLTKPFERQELLALIESLFDHQCLFRAAALL